jgi:hypothetical protein
MDAADDAKVLALKHGYCEYTVKVQDHKVVDVKMHLDFNIAKGERVQFPVR